jgi:hypothetical protein
MISIAETVATPASDPPAAGLSFNDHPHTQSSELQNFFFAPTTCPVLQQECLPGPLPSDGQSEPVPTLSALGALRLSSWLDW